MKKKALSIIIALAMVLTILPSAAFAAQVKHVSGDLELIRQQVQETLDEAYSESMEPESRYSTVIWESVQKVYDDESARINSATSIKELGETWGIFFLVADETMEAAGVIEYLATFTKGQVKSANDFSYIKHKELKALSTAKGMLKKADYNDYYWDVIQDDSYEANLRLNNATDFITLAKARYYIENNFEEFSYDSDDDYYDDDDDLSYMLDERLCTKKEMAIAYTENIGYLDLYINEQLKASKYTGNMTGVKNLRDSYAKKIKATEDLDGVINLMYKGLDEMQKLTGVDFELVTNRNVLLMENRLGKLMEQYYEEDYSSKNWEKLAGIYEKAYSKAEDAVYAVQLKETIYTDAKTAMAKVPTAAKQLKENKAKYIKTLKTKFIGSKKYYQTSVKKVIKEATTEINMCRTLDEAESTYYEYYYKAKDCIKKYTITTKKYGNGTVTASKKINYGSNFTVKMTPVKGYKVSKITVDGKKVKSKTKYTFKSVKKVHTLKVWFKKK